MMLVRNFGLLYEKQDRLEEAEYIYQRALAGYERRSGQEHYWTRNMMGRLAGLYHRQGKVEEAALVYQRHST